MQRRKNKKPRWDDSKLGRKKRLGINNSEEQADAGITIQRGLKPNLTFKMAKEYLNHLQNLVTKN